MSFSKLNDKICYSDTIHKNSKDDDDQRRLVIKDNLGLLKNPRYLFISLRNKGGEIIFDILNDSIDFKWKFFENKYTSYLEENTTEFIVIDGKYLLNESKGQYITCDLDYKIELTSNKKYAIPFYFSENDGIHFIKPKLRLDFDINNLTYNVDIDDIRDNLTSGSKNIGLLLMGGFGSRFDSKIQKQLYKLDSIPLFLYSLKILVNTLDLVVIVSNSRSLDEVLLVIKDSDINKEQILIATNDKGDRLNSIEVGLNLINKLFSEDILNVVIHDGARPFIQEKHIRTLLSVIKDNIFYSQYYISITNGLLKCENNNYEEVNRDLFVEICTPVCVNFGLMRFLFSNYLKNEKRICWEIIPLLDIFRIEYELVKGSVKILQKITIKEDLEDDLEI